MSEDLEVTREEDEAFEALARRNDVLEDEKHTLAKVADQQDRRIEVLEARVAAERNRADALAARYATLADEVRAMIQDSDGLAGYHLNGDVAAWGEFDIESLLEESDAEGDKALAQLKARVAADVLDHEIVRTLLGHCEDCGSDSLWAKANAVIVLREEYVRRADEIAAGGSYDQQSA